MIARAADRFTARRSVTDEDLIGSIVHAPNGRARIIVCSQLLQIALLERLDDCDQPTGEHSMCDPTKLQPKQEGKPC